IASPFSLTFRLSNLLIRQVGKPSSARNRSSRSSARFSFYPRTLTSAGCPFAATPGLQPQSWINENNNSFNVSINSSSIAHVASQAVVVRRWHNDHAGERRDGAHGLVGLHVHPNERVRLLRQTRGVRQRDSHGHAGVQYAAETMEPARWAGEHF